MGFSGHINIASDTIWNGIIMVDPVNGDDGTGERNVINRPFATIDAAYAVYQEGDLIRVLPGTINLLAAVNFNNGALSELHIEWLEGSKIVGDIAGQLFNCVTGHRIYWYGRGEFRNDNVTLGNNVAAIGASGKYNIKGAKKISMASGTAFGATGGWELIENVEEIYSENGYTLIASTNPWDNAYKGIVRNCKKIGDLAYPFGISFGYSNNNTFVIENCNIFGSGASNTYVGYFSISNGKGALITNTNFISDTFRAVSAGDNVKFVNCHFQQNSGVNETVITNSSTGRTIFENCTFRHKDNGRAMRVLSDAEFHGVNKFYTELSVEAVYGFDDEPSINTGTIYANKMNTGLIPPAQTWSFPINTDPPTAGETYTITAPDATSISYLVQPADTRTDVINGLAAAWDAEVLATSDGFFAKFDNKVINLGPSVWRILATAIDSNDNLDPDNGFVFDTDGTDNVSYVPTAISGFFWTGPGKFFIDENMVIPNL